MKAKVVEIGNSVGIQIPKSIFLESGLKNEVELKVSGGHIIIKPISANRKSWDTAFKKMAKNKDDVLLDTSAMLDQSKWDSREWKW